MLPSDISEWLESSPLHEPVSSRTREEQDAIREQLCTLGIAPNDEMYDFYLRYRYYTVRGWYELNDVSQIAMATAFAHRELSVSSDFVALTGVQGGGITLYNRKNGSVFDVEFGQFEKLASGQLAPIANSFVEYLRWCKVKDEDSA